MKRIIGFTALLVTILAFPACSQSTPAKQDIEMGVMHLFTDTELDFPLNVYGGSSNIDTALGAIIPREEIKAYWNTYANWSDDNLNNSYSLYDELFGTTLKTLTPSSILIYFRPDSTGEWSQCRLFLDGSYTIVKTVKTKNRCDVYFKPTAPVYTGFVLRTRSSHTVIHTLSEPIEIHGIKSYGCLTFKPSPEGNWVLDNVDWVETMR